MTVFCSRPAASRQARLISVVSGVQRASATGMTAGSGIALIRPSVPPAADGSAT